MNFSQQDFLDTFLCKNLSTLETGCFAKCSQNPGIAKIGLPSLCISMSAVVRFHGLWQPASLFALSHTKIVFFQRLLFSLISWILSRSIGRWVHPTDPLKTFAISFPNNLCKCNFHFPKYKYEHWNFSKNKDWEGKEISSIKSTWNKNHPSPFSWIYDQSTAGMLMNKKYWNLAG